MCKPTKTKTSSVIWSFHPMSPSTRDVSFSTVAFSVVDMKGEMYSISLQLLLRPCALSRAHLKVYTKHPA